jgi:hypothetical protein
MFFLNDKSPQRPQHVPNTWLRARDTPQVAGPDAARIEHLDALPLQVRHGLPKQRLVCIDLVSLFTDSSHMVTGDTVRDQKHHHAKGVLAQPGMGQRQGHTLTGRCATQDHTKPVDSS